jgi:hypothetical protein
MVNIGKLLKNHLEQNCRQGWMVKLGLTGVVLWSVMGNVAPAAMGAETNANRFLVIAPEKLQPALKDFIAYKNQVLPTEGRSLESIVQKASGVDDPEKLKRFLYEEWRQKGLGYVLLVGDVDVMPVRYMALDRVTPAAFDYAFYPSDLYYSDLARADGSFDDWNQRKEGFHAAYFGEVRGEKNKSDPINYDQIHYRPEIAVGRWPVSLRQEVGVIAAKTMAFEERMRQDPHQPSAGFLAVSGWVDSRSLLNRLAAQLTNGWQVEKRYYSDARRQYGTPPPNHEQVRSLLNCGLDLLVHTGHGQPDAWEQCFNLRDLAQITNSTCLPVIISAGCSTAHFATLPPYEPYADVHGKPHKGSDQGEVFTEPPPPPAAYQRWEFNPNCLGEEVLKRGPNGAVAYIGCNTGSQPCGLTLVAGFIKALAEAPQPRLGDCWAGAIRYFYDQEHLADLKPNADWYPPSIFFQGMKFMLFGDPTLPLPANLKSSK